MSEQVLTFPASLLSGWHLDFINGQGVLSKPLRVYQLFMQILNSDELAYVDRGPAEINPHLKQLIPYVVFAKGDKFFVYQRTKKGGESRLHDLYSIGVGGHINPCDGETINNRTYWRGLAREMAEEVSIVDVEGVSRCVNGLIYDPSNDVGKVHFGVVHFFPLSGAATLESNDPALSKGQWVDRQWLSENYLKFENWSKLVISNLL